MHAEKCPICDGKGKIKKDDFKPLIDSETCHGCGGKGWIEVQDDTKTIYIPYPPYPEPYPYTPWPQPITPYYQDTTAGTLFKPKDVQVWC